MDEVVLGIANKAVACVLGGKGPYHRGHADELLSEAVVAVLEAKGKGGEWEGEAAKSSRRACNNYLYQFYGKHGRQDIKGLDMLDGNGDVCTLQVEDPQSESGFDLVDRKDMVGRKKNPPPSARDFLAWAASLRAAVFDSINGSDVSDMMKMVVKKAKTGDLQAVKLVMDYVLGGRISNVIVASNEITNGD